VEYAHDAPNLALDVCLTVRMQRHGKPDAVPYKLVRIEWEDSARLVSARQWIDDYEVPQTVTCIWVGFLIAQTDDALALAPNLGDIGHEQVQASGIIRIPKSAIRGKIRTLRS
jgi:hypothetical protein